MVISATDRGAKGVSLVLRMNTYWTGIVLFSLIIALVTGCTPEQPVDNYVGVEPPLTPTTLTFEPTATPVPTTTSLPTVAPRPTATAEPSPTALPQPNMSRHFDMMTCQGDEAIVSFNEGTTIDSIIDLVESSFYGPEIGFDLWSHFAQQAGDVPLDSSGNPTIHTVFTNRDSGYVISYDVCLKRGASKRPPLGVSFLVPIQIPTQFITAHCEKDYNVSGFLPFEEPETIEVPEQTTVSQFLESHAPSTCYGFHRDDEIKELFNAEGWEWYDVYQHGSEKQFIVAHFWSQGAHPLPSPFDQNGKMRNYKNQFPYNAIIPAGTYEFYGERDIQLAGSSACSYQFIPPAQPVDCYNGATELGTKHEGRNDFSINSDAESGTFQAVFAPGSGKVKVVQEQVTQDGRNIGGNLLIEGTCPEGIPYTIALSHIDPLVSVGDRVEQGQMVAQAYVGIDEVELFLQMWETPVNPIKHMHPDHAYTCRYTHFEEPPADSLDINSGREFYIAHPPSDQPLVECTDTNPGEGISSSYSFCTVTRDFSYAPIVKDDSISSVTDPPNIDFACLEGLPCGKTNNAYNVFPGIVSSVRSDQVQVSHSAENGTYITYYGHVTPSVSQGQSLKVGEVIGLSQGPFMSFAITGNGTYYDPMGFGMLNHPSVMILVPEYSAPDNNGSQGN